MTYLITRAPTGSAHLTCHCMTKPQDTTILHGILTGQGHIFGYGGDDQLCVSPVIVDNNRRDLLHNGVCLDIGASDNHQMYVIMYVGLVMKILKGVIIVIIFNIIIGLTNYAVASL